MPSESLRWETLEALKNSPKGQIKFDPHWLERGEDIFVGYNEVLSLSPFAGAVLDRLTTQSLQTSFVSSGHSSPGLSGEIPASPSAGSVPEVNGKPTVLLVALPSKFDTEEAASSETVNHHSEPDVCNVSSPTLPPALSVLSPRAMEIAGQIRLCEEEYRERAKMALRLRQERQEQVLAAIVSRESEQLKRFEELTELKQRQEHQSMRDMIDRETKESMGRQEKLKEEHRHRIKILNLRLREAELERQREAELERQRQVEGRERLRNLNTIQEEILQLNQLLQLSTQTMTFIPPTCVSTYSTRGNQLCSQVSEVVRKTSEGDFPSMEDMNVAGRALHEMRDLLQLLHKEASEVQEKKKKEQEEEEELKKQALIQAQQEAEKTAAQLARQKAERKGLKSNTDDVTLTWYNQLQESANQCSQSFSLLSSSKDTQIKKLKMELQKAATIPVSQISSISGSQLREIFDKLNKLLSRRPVVTGGRSVSASDHPQGLDFVYYRMAEKFVKQGEEEVASHHEAAFPIAVVASGIWERHPRLGDLILAHLHKKCPYAVPYYPPKKAGTSVEEYQRVLGYRVDDSGVEAHGIFLKRMTGMIRLYAGIIQLKWPDSSTQGLGPHGLNHGWRWVAQMLNMEPRTDVTATLLFDFLEVCGHALMKAYQDQFWKLILLLKEEYFPRIESVTTSGEMASFVRLKQFVETSLRSRYISPPKGQLTASFWRS
ncbi:nucleoporin GLE1 [Thalassophryne amazonica]|uniref:nucleoporin GLE1 n=1 Tax=Thalassophryne amazonica TaxID=390379 RepID=UPI0014718DE6|nr:nucleoporin GLE1 [Thalassophryne amazonica]